jgi:hypothetical protein
MKKRDIFSVTGVNEVMFHAIHANAARIRANYASAASVE